MSLRPTHRTNSPNAIDFKDLSVAASAQQQRIDAVLEFELNQLKDLVDSGQLEHIATPRIGVELEGWLVDRTTGLARPDNLRVLDLIDDPNWTYELGAFNLECRTGIKELTGSALAELEGDLLKNVAEANRMAKLIDAMFVLTGSLPSLRPEDTKRESLTPNDRYARIDELLGSLTNKSFKAQIESPGGAITTFERDSIALATIGCGVQPHLQVSPDEFVDTFNIIQGISALLVAVSANSPLIMGSEGFKESRLTILEQIHSFPQSNGDPTQVRWFFGDDYIANIIDPFRNSLRFKPFMTEARLDSESSPPELPNLRAHGSTVWMFNRARYDILNGQAHVRVECRVPSTAPTIIDNVANMALFYGLVFGIKDMLNSTASSPVEFFGPFSQVKANFYSAARYGLEATLQLGNRRILAGQALAELMGIARHGLRLREINSADIDRYLGVIDGRIATGMTPADRILAMLADREESGLTRTDALVQVVKDSFKWQERNVPVHCWQPNLGVD